jgi:hypothetical protein
MKRKTMIVAAAVLALGAGGVGVATALGSDGESDGSATGPGAEQARAAALAITHGGHANAVERDSENGATWEVEVTKPDGQTVDVRLDSAFNRVVVEADGEHGKDDAGERQAADDHGQNEAGEHGAETNDDGSASQR